MIPASWNFQDAGFVMYPIFQGCPSAQHPGAVNHLLIRLRHVPFEYPHSGISPEVFTTNV